MKDHAALNLKLSEELAVAKKELLFQGEEKAKRAAELVIADAEKAERAAELIIVNSQALYDELTKLPNRRLFIDRFNQALLSSRRSKTYSAMLFLDLDKLKEINDDYGHAVGDLLLIEVAKRLKAPIRDTDTVARFGGDEFATLLNNLDVDINIATSEVEYIALKILNSIAMPISIEHDGQELIIQPQCTVSIGIALFLYETGEEKAFLENVLKSADKAMYQAKKAGGNQIKFNEVNASE